MVDHLLVHLNKYEIDNIPWDSNRDADTMASAISLAPINIEDVWTILIIKNIDKPSHEYAIEDFIYHCYSTNSVYTCEWYQDVFNYLNNGTICTTFDHNARIRLKKLAIKHVIISDLLYRSSFDGTLIRCIM